LNPQISTRSPEGAEHVRASDRAVGGGGGVRSKGEEGGSVKESRSRRTKSGSGVKAGGQGASWTDLEVLSRLRKGEKKKSARRQCQPRIPETGGVKKLSLCVCTVQKQDGKRKRGRRNTPTRGTIIDKRERYERSVKNEKNTFQGPKTGQRKTSGPAGKKKKKKTARSSRRHSQGKQVQPPKESGQNEGRQSAERKRRKGKRKGHRTPQ